MKTTIADLNKIDKRRNEFRHLIDLYKNKLYNVELDWGGAWDKISQCIYCNSKVNSVPEYHYGQIIAVKCNQCGSNWAYRD